MRRRDAHMRLSNDGTKRERRIGRSSRTRIRLMTSESREQRDMTLQHHHTSSSPVVIHCRSVVRWLMARYSISSSSSSSSIYSSRESIFLISLIRKPYTLSTLYNLRASFSFKHFLLICSISANRYREENTRLKMSGEEQGQAQHCIPKIFWTPSKI